MRVEQYEEDHKEVLAEWFQARDLDSNLLNDVPLTGAVAFCYEKPVAIGFLRYVEGQYALIDGLVTDPAALPDVRDKAIDELVRHLVLMAKRSGTRRIMAHSVDKNTILRSQRHGFETLPDTMIALNLISGGM